MQSSSDSPYSGHSGQLHPSEASNDRYGKHWGKCTELSKEQDRQMCEMLKGELDNLLIFAALFSAIVASFTIESYKWLSPNDQNPSPVSPLVAQQVNSLWFFSLSASLGVASIGILCMQWVRQYQNGTVTPTKHGVALRRQRIDGFQKWRVPDIISMLPVTLHLSLVIFGVGLIRLLWEINRPVAATFMAGSILSTTFVLGTLFAPALQFLWIVWHPSSWVSLKRFNSQCPYQSPQAWIGYLIIWPLIYTKTRDVSNWATFDTTWMTLVNCANRGVGANKGRSKAKEGGQSGELEKDKADDKSRGESEHNYTDQMVEAEFNWMDREFRHDIAGIKARAEAFEQLSVDAARGIVDKLPVSVQYTPNTNQGVLYMKVWYLWAYARDRPGLDEAYMKARVQYMSELDQGMVTLPGRSLGRPLDISSLVQDKFLVPRFLRCLQTMAKNHAIANEVSQEMWSIIGDLVEYSFRHSHTEYLLTLGNLFDALHQGLESPTPAPSTIQDTINHILEGLAFLWKLHPDEPTPRLKDDNAKHMEKFVHLINHLTCYVQVPQPSPAASHIPSQTRDGAQETVASKSSHVVPTKEKITLRDDQWAKWDALTTLLGKWTEALQKVHSRDATLVPAKSTASALPSAPSTSVQGNT